MQRSSIHSTRATVAETAEVISNTIDTIVDAWAAVKSPEPAAAVAFSLSSHAAYMRSDPEGTLPLEIQAAVPDLKDRVFELPSPGTRDRSFNLALSTGVQKVLSDAVREVAQETGMKLPIVGRAPKFGKPGNFAVQFPSSVSAGDATGWLGENAERIKEKAKSLAPDFVRTQEAAIRTQPGAIQPVGSVSDTPSARQL